MHTIEKAIHVVTEPIAQFYKDVPIFILLVPLAIGYWGWRQTSHLDAVCQNLFGAFQEPSNPPTDRYQLGWNEYNPLFERLPTLREAVRVCRKARYEDTAEQIKLYRTIKQPTS